jgi:hypothetical protein
MAKDMISRAMNTEIIPAPWSGAACRRRQMLSDCNIRNCRKYLLEITLGTHRRKETAGQNDQTGSLGKLLTTRIPLKSSENRARLPVMQTDKLHQKCKGKNTGATVGCEFMREFVIGEASIRRIAPAPTIISGISNIKSFVMMGIRPYFCSMVSPESLSVGLQVPGRRQEFVEQTARLPKE